MKFFTKLNAYLHLIRVPNGFTAIADSWAGYLIFAGMENLAAGHLIYLAVISFCLYSGGIVLNDLHDRNVDAIRNPARPLIAGTVSVSGAVALLIFFVSVAGLLCAALGWMPLAAGCAVIVSIVMYNIVSKKTIFAPVWMGGCRMFNMMVGMSVASAEFYRSPQVLPASFIGGYVLFLTVSSKQENHRNKGRSLTLLTLLWVGLTYLISIKSGVLILNIGIVYLVVWGVVGGVFYLYEYTRKTVSAYRRCIVFFIVSIPAVDAIYAAGAQGYQAGLLVASCLIPAILLSFLYSSH